MQDVTPMDERDVFVATVWEAWNELRMDDPSPVKRIARDLGVTPGEVAAIVYPPTTFGTWVDTQEPDLPDWSRFGLVDVEPTEDD